MLDKNFTVIAAFDHGQQLIENLHNLNDEPHLVVMDVDMPVMNGFQTLQVLQAKNITTPVLMVTMINDENALIKAVKLGARGFLSKEIEPKELSEAIYAILTIGYHFTESLTGRLVNHIQNESQEGQLNAREMAFIKLCCSELTYQEIAHEMHLSPKTIDGYRAKLFERFQIKSRVGLVMLAFKKGWVESD